MKSTARVSNYFSPMTGARVKINFMLIAAIAPAFLDKHTYPAAGSLIMALYGK